MWELQTVIWVNTVFWDSNMDTQSQILTLWLFGRHSSEILQTELLSLLITLLLVEKQNGGNSLE